MYWTVQFTNKAAKQARQLNEELFLVLQLLAEDLKVKGPIPGKFWHNYGKLSSKKNRDIRHCHLAKGHPTYVCCWEVFNIEKIVEIYYVGTHEKAPY